jgi:hypothetical protein
MTVKAISVPVEWALHGKTPETGSEGYRVLACSDGDLGRRNFEDVHARFTPGTPHTLPQVSLSYLVRTDHPDGNYLTLAIHEEAAGGMVDHVGREIMFTRYFCVPYHKLRNEAITYTTMHTAFHAIELPEYGNRPLTVELPVIPAHVPSADDLVRQAASLLLSAPVCVLGAERTSVAERLGFIDAVMTLLPYGMRARTAATTWTRASQRGHRFRLFFSDAPRGGDARDHHVTWGRPELTASPADQCSRDYYAWLDDRVHQPVRKLAAATEECGFSSKQVVQLLEWIGIASGDQPLDSAEGGDNLHAKTIAAEGNMKFGEASLLQCVDHLSTGNMSGLKSSIANIANYTGRLQIDSESRNRCQSVIVRNNLLRPGLPAGRLDSRFYDALLPLAFGVPLSYPAYCHIEDCLGTGSPPAQPPNPTLLEAIEKAGLADPAISTIVRVHLGKGLDKWLRQARATVFANMLAETWERPHHWRIICDAFVRCLRLQMSERSYEPEPAWAALRYHGYLARALQSCCPEDPEYQYQTLTVFLQACFPDGLTGAAVIDVLKTAATPATPALLAAVLGLLRSPNQVAMVKELLFEGMCLFTNFSPATKQKLHRYTAGSGATPASRPAIEPGRDQDPTRALPVSTQSVGPEDTVAMPPPVGKELVPGRGAKHVGIPWRRTFGGYIDLGPQ